MKRMTVVFAMLALTGTALAGCSSSGNKNGTTNTSGSTGASTSTSGATSGVAAAAESKLQAYMSAPTSLPITEASLTGSVAGKKVAYLDCGTPVCALGWSFASAAAKVLGINLTRVNAGEQANTVASAFDTVIAQGIDGVIDPALPNAFAQKGLQQLKAANKPAVGIGVVDGNRSLLPAIVGSDVALGKLGAVTADYLVATYGDKVDAVVYVDPELQLTGVMYTAFDKELKSVCPACKDRSANIPIADLGTKAPSDIIADLQSHPDTKQAAFTVGEQAIGLASAMKNAGLHVDEVTAGPIGDSFQQMKDGDMVAGIGYDLQYVDWAAIDTMARELQGLPVSSAVQQDVVPMQVLTKDSVTADMIKNGWTAFPDLVSRFKTLWTAALPK